MMRKRTLLAGGLLLLLTSTGCGGDEQEGGDEVLRKACDGVVDAATIKEASKSERYDRLHDTSDSESHAAAAKTLINENHGAFVCDISIKDAPSGGNHGFSIAFTPNTEPLFSEGETRSYSAYKVYKIGGGVQATTESGSADVYFSCERTQAEDPMTVTGTLHNNLDLSPKARFRVLFRSSTKMVKLLGCTNTIALPDPSSMQPLPMGKN
jgi:hypothetical protein